MPNLEDVKAALTNSEIFKGDNGKELFEAVSNAVLNAKNDRKNHVAQLEKDIKVYKEAVSKLGYDGTGEISSFADETAKALEAGRANADKITGDQGRIATLEKTLKTLTDKHAEAEKKAADLQEKQSASVVRNAVFSKLNGKIFSAELRADTIARDKLAVIGEDGKSVMFADGDNLIDLETGIQKYLEANKEDLKNSQRPGAGGQPSTGGGSGKVMARSAFSQLSPQDQAAHVNAGGTLTD